MPAPRYKPKYIEERDKMRQERLSIRRQLEAATADARAAQENSIDIEINCRHAWLFSIGNGMNALQTLISETMAAKGLRKSQIVSLLGFKNITKGIRRLRCLRCGRG